MSAPPDRTQRQFAREELGKELLHDYSSSDTGVVPARERRSRWHLIALWITLAAGFTWWFVRNPNVELNFFKVAGWTAVALLFGAWGQQLFPGQTSAPSLGLDPVEAWVLAGVLYLALAALAARTANAKALLGYAWPLRREAGP
jgi:hypothetical protein